MSVEYSKYDFIDAERLHYGRYPMLDTVLYRWARKAEETLYDETGVEVYSGASTFEEMRFSAFFQGLGHNRPIYVFAVEGLPGQALMVMDNRFSAFCLTRRVQNSLSAGATDSVRLTEENQERLQRVVQRLLADLEKSFQGIHAVSTRLRRMTTHPYRARVLGPHEPCLAAQVHIAGRNVSSRISLCIPFVMLEAIISRLGNRTVLPPVNLPDGPLRHFEPQELLDGTSYRMPVRIGEIPARSLAEKSLAKGDILPLEGMHQGHAALALGDDPAIEATVGEIDGHLALKVEGLYNPPAKKRPDPARFKPVQWPQAQTGSPE